MESDTPPQSSEPSSTGFTLSGNGSGDSRPAVLLGEGGASGLGWSHIESFLRCQKEFQFKILRGVGVPQAVTPDAFAVGGLFHAGRAYWFSTRFSMASDVWSAIREVVRNDAGNWNLPITSEAETKALELLAAYMNHYSVREHADPVAAEYLLDATQLTEGDAATFRTTRLDDVSRYPEAGGQLCIGEAKTTSESVAECIKQYTLHGQIMLQALLWRKHPNGEALHGPIAGAMLDVVKKPYGKKKPDFGRQLIPITDYQLAWFERSLSVYLRDAGNVNWNSDTSRNVHSCTRLISGRRVDCAYKSLCMHGRSASSQYVLADGTPLNAWVPSEGKEVPPWL